MRKGYTVYRYDLVTGKEEAVGSILERRRGNRDMVKNMLVLLVEARRLFGRTPADANRIVLDFRRDLQPLPMDEAEGETAPVTTGGSPDFRVARFEEGGKDNAEE